jgi:hypothetical protein
MWEKKRCSPSPKPAFDNNKGASEQGDSLGLLVSAGTAQALKRASPLALQNAAL